MLLGLGRLDVADGLQQPDRVNLSKSEINALREELSHLARDYRDGVMRYVKGR